MNEILKIILIVIGTGIVSYLIFILDTRILNPSVEQDKELFVEPNNELEVQEGLSYNELEALYG